MTQPVTQPDSLTSQRTSATIDYIELYAESTGPMKAFYGAAFGWTFRDYGDKYAGFSDGSDAAGGKEAGGKEAGGINALEAHRPPLVVLHTDDLEASRAAVSAAGGTLIGPIQAFPGGRRFHFRDPAGNELAVWTKQTTG